jgi:hypothetical protein
VDMLRHFVVVFDYRSQRVGFIRKASTVNNTVRGR